MTLAAQIQGVVVSWQIYDVTRDPLSLGLIGLAEALPYVGIALFAGHVADRQNRRAISLASLAVLVCCSLALLGLSIAGTGHAHGASYRGVWPYYLVIFLSGIARSFLQPARQALGAELVPRELYPNAVAWRSSTWQTGAVAGPALGGLLYGFTSPSFAYGVDAGLMIVALLAFGSIAYQPRGVRASETSVGESLCTGIQFVMREPVLLGAMTLDLFSVLLGGAATAGFCGPDLTRRAAGTRSSPRSAGRGSDDHVDLSRSPAALPQSRSRPAQRRRALRALHHRLWPLTQLCPVAGAACYQRYGG